MDVFPFWFFFGFFLKRLFCFPCIFCFSAVSPRSILLDKALGESLFRSFVPHFINHHALKLRHIYQLANGGPVPACTPLHTWISLITSLALPDYSQTLPWIGLPTGLCVCVCAREWFFFFVFFLGGVCRLSWLLIAHHLLHSEEHISSNSRRALWLKQCLARTPHAPSPTRRITAQ